MSQTAIRELQCLSSVGLHRVAYKEWGDPSNPRVLICVHGLTRVSDDFDALAQALCGQYRVICPDLVGRGRSGWLQDPRYYEVQQYLADMVSLIARLDVRSVHWLGTSLGGLIGMVLASLPDTPVRKLVLNDIGPALDPLALTRIGEYVGQPVRFAEFDKAAEYVRQTSLSFGPHSEAQWHKLAADVLRQNENGEWQLHYDPALALPFKTASVAATQSAQQMLWAAYDAIRCPTLLIRGAESDLLSADTAQVMIRRGPHAELVEVPGTGHAPTLVRPEQIDIVQRFLLS
ncbi:MAG TPA: alpha/beta hydrolase [Oxalicibacterium sp.]|nr:alpha/beta hydrolase [Oxalicibacterium sp.]